MLRLSQVVVLTLTMWGGLNIDFSQTREPKMQHGKTTVYSVRILPDGKRFISASYDGTVIMWDMSSSRKVWQVDLDGESESKDSYTISHLQGMDVAPNGMVVAVSYYRSHVVKDIVKSNDEYQIGLLDSRTGQDIRVLRGHTAPIGRVVFSPNSELLLSEGGDSTARLWNVKTGQEVLQIKLKEKGASVAFSPNGNVLAVATQPLWGLPPQDIVSLYDSHTGQLLRGFPRTRNAVTSLAFSPDGEVLAITSGDANGAQIDLWRVKAQEPLLTLPMPHRKIKVARFSPDGQWLALGGFGRGQGLVELRAVSANAPVRTLRFEAEVTALDFTPDGKQLVVGTDGGQISRLPL